METHQTIIQNIATKILGHKPYTGTTQPFYTPQEWKQRGEQYGHNSLLIIIHDGGDYAPLLNLDYQNYQMYETMRKELETQGYYTEQCTNWYSALYPIITP